MQLWNVKAYAWFFIPIPHTTLLLCISRHRVSCIHMCECDKMKCPKSGLLQAWYLCTMCSNLATWCPKSGWLQVSFANAIAPLAELDAHQFPLVQACLLPRMVSPSEDVCRASAEAEKRLDSHFVLCRCIVTYSYYITFCIYLWSLYVSQVDIYVLLKIMCNHTCWLITWFLWSCNTHTVYPVQWAFLACKLF